jgi:hypothetical protein
MAVWAMRSILGSSTRMTVLSARVRGLIAIVGAVAGPTIALAQPWNDHRVPAPTLPGPMSLERNADAFMASHGYRFIPNLTKYGSVSGYSPATTSISLNRGRWAIAILDRSDGTCRLDTSYRDVGYTSGKKNYRPNQGPDFLFIPLNVESSPGGISVTVRDSSFRAGDRFQQCGYELRFYSYTGRTGTKGPAPSRSTPPSARAQCRPCESWNDQQQRCIQWRACY